MTEHTLAVLTAIFVLLNFAYNVGVGVSGGTNKPEVKVWSYIFGLCAFVFNVWLLLTILF